MTDIMIIGEAWGEQEEREGRAFVGPTGSLLNQMLTKAGIKRSDCYLTNVFNFRPPGNKIEYLCGTRQEGIPGYPSTGKLGYIRKQYQHELERLANELDEVNPNVVIAMGNIPTWAMLGKTSISKVRGVVELSTHTVSGYKTLPTFHPAAVFRQWPILHTTVADLIKAKRESVFPEVRRPQRQVWIEPTLEDIHDFTERYIKSASLLAIDIETAGAVITRIGFAPGRDVAIVIPGIGMRRTGRDYWKSVEIERAVYKAIKNILLLPVPKVFQNGLYDIAFIWRAWRLRVMHAEEDTMLLHHALQPESLKSLGFLGSIYTDEGAWKTMREEIGTIKRED